MSRVTVVTCVRNGGRYLAEQLRSICAQKFDDWDMLLFDDGSTDNVPKIAREFAGRDGRIVYHRREAGNYVDRLVEACELATGEIIVRCDGDDVCEPDRFGRQVAHLDRHPECVAVGSRLTETDPLGVPLKVTDQPLEHDAIERLLLSGNGWAIAQPASAFRLSAYREVGGYRPMARGIEDLDLFLRLARVGKLANLKEPLVRYRRHLKSVNATLAREQNQRAARVLSEAHAARDLPEPDRPKIQSLPDPEKMLKRWAWNALARKRPDAARHHAWRLLKRKPVSPEAWKTMLFALRGR